MFVSYGVRSVWAFRLTLPTFVPLWDLLHLSLGFLNPFTLHLPFMLLWACWLLFLSFLPCWPIGLATSFLGLPQPIYSIFTSYSSHGPAGCHFCHVGPWGLQPLSLGFLSPFTLSLPFIPPTSQLVVIPAMLAIGFNNLLLPFMFPFPLLLGFFCCWAFCQKWALTFRPLSIWIAPTIHIRTLMQFSFMGFLNVDPTLLPFLL